MFSIQHVDVSHFDGWKLKKSILNTLFEAVKAITGGITAINGQLIKGSGYVISAGGKVNSNKIIIFISWVCTDFYFVQMKMQVVSASGDAVTNVGKLNVQWIFDWKYKKNRSEIWNVAINLQERKLPYQQNWSNHNTRTRNRISWSMLAVLRRHHQAHTHRVRLLVMIQRAMVKVSNKKKIFFS